MEMDASFGAWVAQRRKMLDMTRERLAQCAGCSVSALRKIEGDERRPSRQLAELLADCLQIPPTERPTFLQVARGQLLLERLAAPPPADTITPPNARLPLPPTPLIGREAELAALAAQQGIRGGGARDAGGSGGTSGAANRQSGGGGSIDARSGSVSDSGSRPLTPSTPAGWGPIESDPRQSGLNYFYLVQKTTKAGATMVAEFCRADGLEAYVVPANNGRDFDVFVAPGHAPEARQSATVKSLESKINEIKIKWKARFGRDEIGISLERYRG